MSQDRADYGLDAPGVVRNLLLAGGAALLLALLVRAGVVPRVVRLGPVGFDLLGTGLGAGLALMFGGLWIIYSSRIGKRRRRERLLDALNWTGGEMVLDVGCGRGLMMIGAARRLTSGRAVGIDIWRSEDLSGNRPEATLANAAAEGVSDRVRVETADMRKLPFPDDAFDVVLSCFAIHNLDAPGDRDTAIAEISRVLKPGGRALIDDIRHISQYRNGLALGGCRIVRRLDNPLWSLAWTAISWGSLWPGTLLVEKRVERRETRDRSL